MSDQMKLTMGKALLVFVLVQAVVAGLVMNHVVSQETVQKVACWVLNQPCPQHDDAVQYGVSRGHEG